MPNVLGWLFLTTGSVAAVGSLGLLFFMFLRARGWSVFAPVYCSLAPGARMDFEGRPAPNFGSSLSSSPIGSGALDGVRVLVVEDSPDNQLLLKRLLQKAGAEVSIAENGQVGMEMAMSQRFDVVVMDIQMPVMDGIEATQSLRHLGFIRPIVALTAHGRRGDRERSLKLGFDEFLDKPIQTRLLIQSLAELAFRSRHMPQA